MGEFMLDRVVDIVGPLTIQDGFITSYKLYRIRSRKGNSEYYDTTVERRYSDFEYMHSQLIENYGGYLIPRLPEKNILTTFDM